MPESKTHDFTKSILRTLREMFASDPQATTQLLTAKVPCDEAMRGVVDLHVPESPAISPLTVINAALRSVGAEEITVNPDGGTMSDRIDIKPRPCAFNFEVGEWVRFVDQGLAEDGIIADRKHDGFDNWYDVDVRGTLYAIAENRLRRIDETTTPKDTASGVQWAIAMCFKAAYSGGVPAMFQYRLRNLREQLPKADLQTKMRWLMMEIRSLAYGNVSMPEQAQKTLTRTVDTLRRMLVDETPTEVNLPALKMPQTAHR
jgi:hypothetical protein